MSFLTKELNFFPWSKQREICEKLRDHPRVSVRSCHGIGKTAIAAGLACWFLMAHRPAIVITTAPTGRQVKDLLWREIRNHHSRNNLPGRCLTTKWEIDDLWYAQGFSTDEDTKFQGFHSPHILLICDEAAGITQQIYDAAKGILTTYGSKQLLIGNPTNTSGLFYDSHHRLADRWATVHVSAFHSPNFTGEEVPEIVKASLITPEWVEEAKQDWGETSPIYAARVLGEFPDESEDQLIALSWIDRAENQFADLKFDLYSQRIVDKRGSGDEEWRADKSILEEMEYAETTLGADIARHGKCETAIYIRRGPMIIHQDAWSNRDLMYSANRIAAAIRQFGVTRTLIDATGIGAGVGDRLREMGFSVELVWVGESATDSEKFMLVRDEIWWNLRLRFQDGRIGPLKDKKTSDQLVKMKYAYNTRGKIIVTGKEDLLKEGKPSPDRADALALAFAPTNRYSAPPLAGGNRPTIEMFSRDVALPALPSGFRY